MFNVQVFEKKKKNDNDNKIKWNKIKKVSIWIHLYNWSRDWEGLDIKW